MSRLRKLIGSTVITTLAIVFLAASAVTGNVFQGVGRADLKSQLADANERIEALEDQIDTSQGETECRSRIASASELQSGRILVAIADLVIAARERDDALGEVALVAIASARTLLGPALDARQEAVELCKDDPTYRVPHDNVPDGIEPDGTDFDPTTTTTPARATRRSTTTTTTGTTTTVYRSNPDPTSPPTTCLVPVPLEPLCL